MTHWRNNWKASTFWRHCLGPLRHTFCGKQWRIQSAGKWRVRQISHPENECHCHDYNLTTEIGYHLWRTKNRKPKTNLPIAVGDQPNSNQRLCQIYPRHIFAISSAWFLQTLYTRLPLTIRTSTEIVANAFLNSVTSGTLGMRNNTVLLLPVVMAEWIDTLWEWFVIKIVEQLGLCIETGWKVVYCVRAKYPIFGLSIQLFATSNRLKDFCDLQYTRIKWHSIVDRFCPNSSGSFVWPTLMVYMFDWRNVVRQCLNAFGKPHAIFCLFVWGLSSQNVSLIWRRQHYRWRAESVDLCSALMAI